jgi:hypothetical protein
MDGNENWAKAAVTGSTLTEDNITTEIKQRIVMANQAYYGLKKQLSS